MSKFKPQQRLATRVSVLVKNRVLISVVTGFALLSIVAVLIIAQMGQNKVSLASTSATSTKTYSDLTFKKVIRTYDANYVISDGVNFIKVDSLGNVMWSRTIDPQYPILIQSLIQTSDNSIVALSQTNATTGTNSKVYVTKLESNGTLAWAKLLSKTASEFAYGIAADKSGNIYLTGNGCSSYNYILKIDANGNQDWFNDFTASNVISGAQKIFVNDDNTFTVAGKYTINGAYYLYLNQFDANANWISGKKYSVAYEPLVEELTKSSDGGYVIAGNYANATNASPFIMKTDAASNLQWFETLDADNATSINDFILTSDNNIIVVGNTFVNANENVDEMILKIDMSGNLIWKVAAGSASLNGAGYDDALAVCAGPGNLFYVSGFSAGGFITTMDEAGNGFCHTASFNLQLTMQSVDISTVAFTPLANNTYTSTDVSISIQNLSLQSPDVCYGSQASSTGIQNVQQSAAGDDTQINIYPNPNQGIYTVQFLTARKNEVSIEVFDVAGRQVLNETVAPGAQQFQVNQSTFSNGTYFVTVKDGETVLKQSKILVQHQ